MEASAENLRLLALIVPVFQTATTEAIGRSLPGSEAWRHYNAFHQILFELYTLLPPLQESFGKLSSRPHEGELGCRHDSRILLESLEETCVDQNIGHGRRKRSGIRFPRLEEIRRTTSEDHPSSVSFDPALLKRREQDRIRRMDNAVQRLVQFLPPSNDIPASLPAKRSAPSLHTRKMAQTLHNVLGMFWDCQCSARHDYMIFPCPHQTTESSSSTFLAFNMFLSGSSNSQAHWKESKAYVMQLGYNSGQLICGPAAPPKREQITSLCAKATEAEPTSRLNLRIENAHIYETRLEASRLELEGVYPKKNLKDLLHDGPILETWSRLMLAVSLAYSVLNYCGTPWLPMEWNGTYFRILASEDGAPLFFLPLLSAGLFPTAAEKQNLPLGNLSRKMSLLQLGITLLEIYKNQPIERSRQEDPDVGGSGTATMDTNFYTAERLFDNCIWDVHTSYRDAVKACLDPRAPAQQVKVDDPVFSHYIHEKIILPLENELSAFGIKPAHFDELTFPLGQPYTKLSVDTRSDSLDQEVSVQAKDGFVQKYTSTSALLSSVCQKLSGTEQSRSLLPRPPSGFELFDDHAAAKDKSKLADRWFEYWDKLLEGDNPLMTTLASSTKEIKIAVLDTGVDMENNYLRHFRERIVYKTFVPGDSAKEHDDADHGTHTAALLLRIAPHTKVFVARVTTSRHLEDPSCITQAIEHASSVWNVDVICLPFGFHHRTSELESLHEALMSAHRKNILMFAAASNRGGLSKVTYPANQYEVICVSSADGLGNPSDFNPSLEGKGTLSALGEGVPQNLEIRRSGTSFAAPVAAAIAAVLMEYIDQCSLRWNERKRDLTLKVKSSNGMLTLMKRCFCEERRGFCLLQPWGFFQKDEVTIEGLILDVLSEL